MRRRRLPKAGAGGHERNRAPRRLDCALAGAGVPIRDGPRTAGSLLHRPGVRRLHHASHDHQLRLQPQAELLGDLVLHLSRQREDLGAGGAAAVDQHQRLLLVDAGAAAGGARSRRRGALFRSCPPAPASGRRLLLYLAAQGAPASRSGAVSPFAGGNPRPRMAKGGGWPPQRSKGGASGGARRGGHERRRPPAALGGRGLREPGSVAVPQSPAYLSLSSPMRSIEVPAPVDSRPAFE